MGVCYLNKQGTAVGCKFEIKFRKLNTHEIFVKFG